MTPYQDSLETHNLLEDLQSSVDFLLQNVMFLERRQWDRLKRIGEKFEPAKARQEVVYDASFSLAEELQAQITAVRAVRDRIMTKEGHLSEDITTREAKEVISSGSTLMSSLMKFHEKVVNMERLRLLETSVVEALEEVDGEVRERVLGKMEEKLANLA